MKPAPSGTFPAIDSDEVIAGPSVERIMVPYAFLLEGIHQHQRLLGIYRTSQVQSKGLQGNWHLQRNGCRGFFEGIRTRLKRTIWLPVFSILVVYSKRSLRKISCPHPEKVSRSRSSRRLQIHCCA